MVVVQPRSGELATRPLPAVLLDLHEDIVTGRLTLRRGKIAKSIDLVNGNPVSTASTPRDETLGHFLVTSGVISEEQHREAVQRASAVGGKLGEALVSLQVLTVEQLIDQLGKQARHKLVQALRWPQGAWRFEEATAPVEGMQLRMIDVVLGGLRETAALDLGRLSRLDGLQFELTDRGKRLRHELRKQFGERMLAILGAGGQMAELEKALGDRMQARIAADVLALCDAIRPRGTAPAAKHTMPGIAVVKTEEQLEQDEDELYNLLFDEETTGVTEAHAHEGEAPLEMDVIEVAHYDDSGVVSTEALQSASAMREKSLAARQAISAELARIQGADHYAVLLIDRDCDREDVEAGYQIKVALLQRKTEGVGTPQDRQKLEQIMAAYMTARATLSDPARRAAYDRELAGGELVEGPPSIDTELNFRKAEEMIAKQQWPQAIGLLKTVISRSPGEADYHAALGWATWQGGDSQPAAADAARSHLNQALSIDPDHPAAHDYKGRIDAALRVDDAGAVFHLERALDLDPGRNDALATIESLLVARGELRRLERILKRLLFRLRGKGGPAETNAWIRLARLYVDHLDNAQGATAAIANARKLAPNHPDVLALATRTESQRRPTRDLPRAGWREALGDASTGAALVTDTAAAGHGDAAFLAASTMVGLGTADDTTTALYEEHRSRKLALPAKALSRDQWALLRHKDDAVDLGNLVDLLAPAVHAMAPMKLADSDIDPSQRVADTDLPPAFARLRKQLALVLGAGIETPVYARTELGSQIHVVACDPPVLAAGDEALTAPERADLVFRLARAMTFLSPGRAIGASRPGRVLKAVVLAVVREAASTELGKDDPLAASAEEALATIAATARSQARAAALRLLARSEGGLNLSLWARALSRTADRAGLLLCGDVPAAFAGAREMGDLDRDLVEFTYGAAHVTLRQQLGLSKG